MSRILSTIEYSAATQEIKALQTAIAQRRIEFLREALRKLNSDEGRKRALARAVIDAQSYRRTIKLAERVALDEMRNPYENADLGRLRLAAAVDEIYGTNTTRKISTTQEPTIAPRIEHGLNAYRRKLCKCPECRGANAAAQRDRRAKQRDHKTKQHTGQTTKAA